MKTQLYPGESALQQPDPSLGRSVITKPQKCHCDANSHHWNMEQNELQPFERSSKKKQFMQKKRLALPQCVMPVLTCGGKNQPQSQLKKTKGASEWDLSANPCATQTTSASETSWLGHFVHFVLLFFVCLVFFFFSNHKRYVLFHRRQGEEFLPIMLIGFVNLRTSVAQQVASTCSGKILLLLILLIFL